MKDPDKIIKESVRRALAILAQYVEPGRRDCEATIDRLLSTLDNDHIAEAMAESDEMEHNNGGRPDEQRPAGQIPH